MFHRKIVIMASVALASLAFTAGPAHAATRAPTHTATHAATDTARRQLRSIAFSYALKQRGKWYCWGGTGPSCYDCSGLVFAAYEHAHIRLGRTTYDMLDSGQLIRISHAQARPGDLAFYGTGHVELFDRGNSTFGAHDAGSRIGWTRANSYWHPTAYYRVRGARSRQ
jgi:cell wall-associated NlpC family hydrolase